MTGLSFAAAVLAGIAVLLWSTGSVPQRRLSRAVVASPAPLRPVAVARSPLRRDAAAVVAAGLAGATADGTAGALALSFSAGVWMWLWRLRSGARTARRTDAATAALAPCADLLAACLSAGSSTADAIGVVAAVVEGPLQEDFERVAAALRVGAEASDAWMLTEHRSVLAPLARAFGRAERSGASLAATVAAVADNQRHARRWQAEAAARRAGVWAVVPLVVCFLPAFVLVGLVPVVVAVATAIASG